MINKTFAFIICLLTLTFSFAQDKNIQSPLFNINQIGEIIALTTTERQALEEALQKRQALIEDADAQTLINANKAYYDAIEALLKEPQKKQLYSKLVTEEALQKRIDKFYKQNNAENIRDLSIDLDSLLTPIIKNGLAINLRFAYNETLKETYYTAYKAEVDNFKNVLFERKRALRKINEFWTIRANACQSIKPEHQDAFTRHQYLATISGFAKAKVHLQALAKTEALSMAYANIATCDAKRFVNTVNLLENQEAATVAFVEQKLSEKLKTVFETKLTNHSSIDKNYQKALQLRPYTKTLINRKETLNKQEAKARIYNSFKRKALKAGLDKSTLNNLWRLMLERQKDLKAYWDSKKKKTDDFSLITEDLTVKTPPEIKKAFSTAVAQLITIKQYGFIMEHKLKPLAKQRANTEMTEIAAVHEFSETQRAKLYSRIALFYYNQVLYQQYYGYDKSLLKRKLSGLRYHFEKDYKATMDAFDIKVKAPRKNNSTLQY